MVWAGICLDGRTDLVVIDGGALTAVRYRGEVLEPLVRPFAGALGQDFVLMHDNARPHTARVVQAYLEHSINNSSYGYGISISLSFKYSGGKFPHVYYFFFFFFE